MDFGIIKNLTVIHANMYSARINGCEVIGFLENDNKVVIALKNNYKYEDIGNPRWDSIEPMDKDEITSLELELKSGEIKNIHVPFKNVSTNGALCINEKSNMHESENYLTIEWQK